MLRFFRQFAAVIMVFLFCCYGSFADNQSFSSAFGVKNAQNINFKDVFIPELEQFQQDNGAITSKITVSFPQGFYLYKDKISLANPELADIPINFSNSRIKEDELFGKIAVFDEQKAEISFTHQQQLPEILLNAQGCKDGEICFPPEQWKIPTLTDIKPAPLEIKNTTVTAKKENRSFIANKLDDNFWTTLPFIFLLGIGLSFTACIYPLIPIVSSLVIGKNQAGFKPYLLTLTYITAMATATALLGAIFGSFNQFNLQAALQKPVFIIPIALFFTALSLALFDFFTLQTPLVWQNYIDRIARKQKSGQFIAAAVLGFISVLVVSPCSTPILTALLIYSTQTSILKAALALFVFGFATGLPLLLFAGFLRKFMPKTGMWSLIIKRIYAWLMLALSCYLFSRAVKPEFSYLIWTAYFLAVAVFFDTQSRGQHSISFNYVMRYLAGISFIAAIIFAMEIFSSQHFLHSSAENYQTSQNTIQFKTVSINKLESIIKQSNKPTIVDIYADWCLSCKRMEKHLSSIPELLSFNRIKINLNNYGEEERNLMQRLNLSGPPALIFYPPNANLISADEKIIGELKLEDLRNNIRNIKDKM
ncbi:MAG: protein-disulfide reductase DsbD [Cardiobacteriaceae bacterium]|nr:protein-disulfide reductase DsbD [Cardiobacteriaceae bacterium]